MKLLLIALTLLPFTAGAAGIKPKQLPVPRLTWAIKPMVRAGAIVTVEDARKIYETTKDAAVSLSNPDVVNDLIQNVGDSITRLSSLTEEQAAVEIVNAIFMLSDLADKAKKQSMVNGGAAFSFVVYPTPAEGVKDQMALDDFPAFRDKVLEGMSFAQRAYFEAPANDRKWYLLGAVGNVRVTTKPVDNDIHLQLVLGLKPQIIEKNGNKVEIPKADAAADMPVAIVDISMPMELTLPKIEINFGKLGQLQSQQKIARGRNAGSGEKTDWRFRFEAAPDTIFCSRAGAVPLVHKTMNGFPLVIPVYSAKIDGNDQRMTNADAKFAGFSFAHPLCWDAFGQVSGQFMGEVNKSITDSTFSDILGLSLRELAERVQRLKETEKGPS